MESEPQQQQPPPQEEEDDVVYVPQYHPVPPKNPLDSFDKTAYIVIFIAFILGFFMGKTMQPVILRSV